MMMRGGWNWEAAAANSNAEVGRAKDNVGDAGDDGGGGFLSPACTSARLNSRINIDMLHASRTYESHTGRMGCPSVLMEDVSDNNGSPQRQQHAELRGSTYTRSDYFDLIYIRSLEREECN